MAKDRPYYRFMVRYGSADQVRKTIDEQPEDYQKSSLAIDALQRKDLPTHVVDHIYHMDNNRNVNLAVTRYAAGHPNLSKEAHEQALNHEMAYVRLDALENPSITTEQLLHHATTNSYPDVRQAALRRFHQKKIPK